MTVRENLQRRHPCQRHAGQAAIFLAGAGIKSGLTHGETDDQRIVGKYTSQHTAREIQIHTTNGKPIEGAPRK